MKLTFLGATLTVTGSKYLLEVDEKKYFAESELIINEDGSCFHLHLRPEQVADKVILVGDPGRVALVASHFDEKECEVSSREFHAITGTYKGKRITVQSTGIGCDNIDIVVNELDALKNIDFKTRTEKPEHTTLTLVRIGTCGGLQLNCPAGTFVASQKSIGFDGLINFYARRNEICDLETEAEFKRQVKWNDQIGNPYCVNNDPELLNQIEEEVADLMARQTLEDRLEKKINEKMEERHLEYVREIKMQVLKEQENNVENPQTLKKYAILCQIFFKLLGNLL